MAENSAIEWTEHTHNEWVGCAKESPACTNCYAESWARRTGQTGLWRGDRRLTTEQNRRKPFAWNRAAEKAGVPARVFCSSLADVFEDHPSLPPWRAGLWQTVEQTPSLRWLLLTKRPQNILDMVPASWRARWPEHVWVGTTVESQKYADERIPELLAVPAPVRFLSVEPMLGALNINAGLFTQPPVGEPDESPEAAGLWTGPRSLGAAGLQWVICGGESGAKARAMDPAWVTSLRDQCLSAGVPFLFKQWGNWAPHPDRSSPWAGVGSTTTTAPSGVLMVRHADKHAAGRTLEGRTWDEVPR
jgi:protein gp37